MRNDFYVGIYEDTYLSHSGIPGMRWYHKNGPPYPLSDKAHDRVVKRAEKSDSKPKSEFYSKKQAVNAADEWHRKGKYTHEYTTLGTFANKFHVEPIKNAKIAKRILKDSAYEEQTKKIKEFEEVREEYNRAKLRQGKNYTNYKLGDATYKEYTSPGNTRDMEYIRKYSKYFEKDGKVPSNDTLAAYHDRHIQKIIHKNRRNK